MWSKVLGTMCSTFQREIIFSNDPTRILQQLNGLLHCGSNNWENMHKGKNYSVVGVLINKTVLPQQPKS